MTASVKVTANYAALEYSYIIFFIFFGILLFAWLIDEIKFDKKLKRISRNNGKKN
jgi:hypothetical protein